VSPGPAIAATDALINWIEAALKRELTKPECRAIGVLTGNVLISYEHKLVAKLRDADFAYRNN